MATRSRTSFQKRQKEILRMEKQRDKAARRLQRKNEEKQPETDDTTDMLITGEEPAATADHQTNQQPEGSQ
jgi:hypothetical protein